MKRARIGGGAWLTAGLWAAALALDAGILLATLSGTGGGGGEGEEPVPEPAGRGPFAVASGAGPGGRPRAAEAPPRPGGHERPAGEVRLKAVRPAPPDPGPSFLSRHNGAPPPARPAPLVPVEHTVAPGETLIALVEGYLGSGATWREVAAANDIERPDVLEIGRKLAIPGASVARSRARVRLAPPSESPREEAARRLFGAEANLPPPGAFEPAERGLRLVHPLWEAYPWRVPAVAGAGFLALALGAAAFALRGAEGRLGPRAFALAVGWGAAAAAGAALLVGGTASLAAARIARSAALEVVLALAAGGLVGAAGYAGAVWGPGRAEAPARLLARGFAAALGILVAAAILLCAATGWLSSALASLRPPW